SARDEPSGGSRPASRRLHGFARPRRDDPRHPASAQQRRQLRHRASGALRSPPGRAGARRERAEDPARRQRSPRRRVAGAVATPPGRRYLLRVRALTDTWTLGGLRLANRVVLAPLAGIGSWFVRLQAKRHGAGLVVSEMVSSFGLVYGDARTHREFLRIHPDEHPVSMQLFGHDAAVMREAAAIAAGAGADLIDLNMGCPVRKVCRTGAGAALLDDPDRAVAI